MLQKDRLKFNRIRLTSLCKSILLIKIESKEKIGKGVKFFKGYPVSQSTIVKGLDTNIAWLYL